MNKTVSVTEIIEAHATSYYYFFTIFVMRTMVLFYRSFTHDTIGHVCRCQRNRESSRLTLSISQLPLHNYNLHRRPGNRHPISAGIHSSSKMPITRNIHGRLPSRYQANTLPQNTPCDRVGELLEDWLSNMSGCT